MPLTVNLNQAKLQLSRLLLKVQAGEEILITKGGKPMARLTPLATKGQPRQLGTAKGKVRIAKDFDAPVPGFKAFYR